jgi:Glycosyltransferase family 87
MVRQASLRGFDPRPLRIPLSILGMLFIVGSFVVTHGWDLRSYTEVDLANPYAGIDTLNEFAVFRYAPPIALVAAPLGALPFEVVALGWLGLQLAALWYIARGWALALVVFPPVWLDIVYGNINILLAAMVVAGLRYPAVWVFGLLTKVTPGIGLLWFVARREWRPLAIAGGTLLAIVGVSLVIQGPEVWIAWFQSLDASRQMAIPFDALPIPLVPRLLAAAVLITWGALGSRRWVLPVAVVLAMPVIWVISLTPLIALWPRDRLAAYEFGRASAERRETAAQGSVEVRAH